MIIKKFPGLILCFLLIAVLGGCATAPQPKFLYFPELPSGVETFQTAQNDLSAILNNRTKQFRVAFGPGYLARQGIQEKARGYNPKETARNIQHCVGFSYNDDKELISVELNGITTTDQGFRLSPQIMIPYSDLYSFPISVGLENIIGTPSTALLIFSQKDRELAQRVADYLYFMQQWEKRPNNQTPSWLKN